MKMFDSISSIKIAEIIKSAKERVILTAPGIHVTVAHSLVEAGKKLGEDRVKVTIDSAEDVCRLGYGHIDAVTILLQNSGGNSGGNRVKSCFLLSPWITGKGLTIFNSYFMK